MSPSVVGKYHSLEGTLPGYDEVLQSLVKKWECDTKGNLFLCVNVFHLLKNLLLSLLYCFCVDVAVVGDHGRDGSSDSDIGVLILRLLTIILKHGSIIANIYSNYYLLYNFYSLNNPY